MFAASKSGKTTGSTPPPPTPTNDPQFPYVTALLTGDGTNGAQNNTFIDSSPNNFTITRAGNTTQGSASPYGGNWSNYFDGSSYLTVPAGTAFAPLTGDFTVEGWINPSGLMSGYGMIYGQTYSGSNYFTIFATDGTVKFINPSGTWSSGANLWTVGSWNHFAVVRNGGSTRVYLNGLGGTAAADAYNYNEVTVLPTIGRYTHTGSNFYYGYISNLRYVKGTALYTANFTPSTTPLTAITNTSLLTCQSNRFIDNSINNFTVTKYGDTRVQVFSPFSPVSPYSTSVNGGSMYFDGGGDYLTINDPAYNLSVGSGDFTYETWVYLDTLPAIVSSFYHLKNDTGTGTTVFILEITSGGAVSLSTGLVLIASGTSGKLIPKTWVHFAFVRTSGVFKTYINGVQDISIANTTTYNGTYVQVGAWRYGSYDYSLTGYLSNTRIAKGTAVYTSNFVPPVAPVTAISGTSLLLNGTNGGIIDNAMMNDYETVGNAQVSTAVVKYGTGSMYFDGTGDYLISPISLSLGMGSGDFTIEGWFYLPSPTYTQGLFHINATPIGGTVAGYAIGVTPSGAVQYYSGNTFTTASSTITANTWTHLAMVRSAGTVKVYVNGVLPTTGGSIADSQNLTTALAYLGVFYAPNYPMVGYIDDFRITKYARYVANFTPPTQAFPTF